MKKMHKGLQRLINYLDNMSKEQSKEFVQDYRRFSVERDVADLRNALHILDRLASKHNLEPEVVKTAEYILRRIDKMPTIYYASKEEVVFEHEDPVLVFEFDDPWNGRVLEMVILKDSVQWRYLDERADNVFLSTVNGVPDDVNDFIRGTIPYWMRDDYWE